MPFPRPPCPPDVCPPMVGLVYFGHPAKHSVTVHQRHLLTELLLHAPRALVGHSQLALRLLRGDAVWRRREQEDRAEPQLQRRPATSRTASRQSVECGGCTTRKRKLSLTSTGTAWLNARTLGMCGPDRIELETVEQDKFGRWGASKRTFGP